jgi:hypothetical protein
MSDDWKFFVGVLSATAKMLVLDILIVFGGLAFIYFVVMPWL